MALFNVWFPKHCFQNRPQNLVQKIERFINQWEITTSLKKAACAQLFAIFIMAHNLWA